MGTEDELVLSKIYHQHQEVLDQEDISQKLALTLQKLQICQDGHCLRQAEPRLKKQKQIEIKLMIFLQHLEPNLILRKEQAQQATLAAQTEDIQINWVPLKI